MKNRCNNPNQDPSRRYGTRNIKICSEWKESFIAFWEWAQRNGYSDNLTIDRIDYNGDYCPENCRWATQKEQQNNRSSNRRIDYNGEVKTLSQWVDTLGLNYNLIESRLQRGWSAKEAFETKMRNKWRKGIGVKQRQYKHGHSGTPTYLSWKYMRAICLNPNHPGYRHIGGRGVGICSDWKDDFKKFYEDMGEKPRGYALIRKNLSGDFCKDNCVWVPRKDVTKKRN